MLPRRSCSSRALPWQRGRTVRLSTFFFLCVCASPALSQNASIDALSLQSGVHARILRPADSKYIFITVASTTPDSLRYSFSRGSDTKTLAWQRINKMDASVGSNRHFGRGLGIGLLVGLVGGAILGAAAEPGQDFTRGLDAALAAGYFGFFGAIGGAVVGLAWRTENWAPVAIPRSTAASNQPSVDDP